MLKVRNDLCIGCGLCAESCPQWAISLRSGQARINQVKCNQCGLCLNVCPQRAIVELTPVLKEDLVNTVGLLKQKADDLIGRLEKLRPVSGTKTIIRGGHNDK